MLRYLIPLLIFSFLCSFPLQGKSLDFHDRVSCQRTIERVYWNHRIWPDSNPGPKPELEQIISSKGIQSKVEDSLRISQALKIFWNINLDAETLQAELERIASATKDPSLLKDLWDALDNDPNLIAECLVRPAIASRLIQNYYAFDGRFHGAIRNAAERSLQQNTSADSLRSLGDSYNEYVFYKNDVPLKENLLQSWASVEPEVRKIFGNPQKLSLGVVSALQEDEFRFYVIAILEETEELVRLAQVTWPKTSFTAWWKKISGTIPLSLPDSEYQYELPDISSVDCEPDTWSPMRSLPRARDGHSAVWTGTEMVIWGGLILFNNGGRYNAALDVWYPVSTIGEPEQRVWQTAVWTGTEMIIWGGWNGPVLNNMLNNGGRYNPQTDSWIATSTSGAPSGRSFHSAIWTGNEMIVWGGCNVFGCDTNTNTGGRYDPQTDQWVATSVTGVSPRNHHTTVWTGTEMIVWGGVSGGAYVNTGDRYNPASDSWSPISLTNAPELRGAPATAVWSGSVMVIWGGCPATGCTYPLNTGGRYDPITDSWLATNTAGAPEGRWRHTAIWSGNKMIVWGGCVDPNCSWQRDTGGLYDPGTDTWTPTSTTGTPFSRAIHSAVWTGTEMIIWGGCYDFDCLLQLDTGGRYNPASDSWLPTSIEDSPSKRVNHTAVWTGAEMIVWGGVDLDFLFTGKRYDPATDHWTGMNILGSPGARDAHTAVWTGTEMIIWGGRMAGVGVTITGGRYNPTTDTWVDTSLTNTPPARSFHTAIWSGAEMIVWGGCGDNGCATFLSSGGRYDPITDSWLLTTVSGAPSGRYQNSAVWSGSEMIIWGGFPLTNTGGRYSPSSNAWIPTSLTNAPSSRHNHSGIWSGSDLIVWGGSNGAAVTDTGAIYNPAQDSWTATSTVGAPEPRAFHTAVWHGSQMIIWGGCANAFCTDEFYLTGGRYDPADDSWISTGTGAFTPFERTEHTAVWTGSEMLIWGGWKGNSATFTNTGARYCGGLQPPDFSIICSPASLNAVPGGSATSTCTITSQANFNDPVTLSCGDLPADVSCSFDPNPVEPPPNESVNSTMTVTVGSDVPFGSYPFQATGTSGSLSHSFPMNLNIVECIFSISPASETFDAAGGTGTVSVTAPPGCIWTATSNDFWITVTAGGSGNGNGTVEYLVDPNPTGDTRIGTMIIATQTFTVTQSGDCLFCDEFEDGILNPNWTYIKSIFNWSESGGSLIGTSIRKTQTHATPVFSGCTACYAETIMRTAGGAFNRVWFLFHVQDKNNLVELMMKEETDRWVLKHRINKEVVAKEKFIAPIDPNTDYVVRIRFDGTNFIASINGIDQIVLAPGGAVSGGSTGFKVKGTTGTFQRIEVN